MANDTGYRAALEDAIEPIAIIGLSCRFPGEATSPVGLWDMMANARTGHSKIPANRFNIDAWYHPNNDRRGTMNVKSGFFIKEDVSLFDAPFFSITAKEAAGMDPMQRIMLEVAYEGFENAGIPIDTLPGSQTAVYCGCFTGDFDVLSNYDIYDPAPNAATGVGRAMLSNRVSWFFDLRGSSLTIDTACSSSLYALHLACQSLRLGESKQALVSGANLVLYPNMMNALTDMHFLSPDGICHSFDERANGYARGDALGALILKPLKQALADGDTIRAVIRGTGANQDGKTPGITMPNPDSQAELIRTTYANAGLPFHETGYFEAHGTGTGLGDPMELSAIGQTFGASRSAEQTPLYVGTIKSNIGHTEGCAGLAGVLKAVLCLEKGLLPPNAGFENLNPKLRLDDWRIALPESTMVWPSSGVRRVSVNSFGYGGSNAHAILDDAHGYLSARGLFGNHQTSISRDSDSDSGMSTGALMPTDDSDFMFKSKRKLLVFSSQDQGGIQRISTSYQHFFEKLNNESKNADLCSKIASLAYTLASRRTRFDYRSFAVVDTSQDLISKLAAGLPKHKRVLKHDNSIWVFTGQGAQWPSMGKQLLGQRVFLASMLQTQTYLESFGCPWDLVEEVQKTDDSKIDFPEFSQPICTALQIALVDLLHHWGVKPKATVGHSSGEIGAAYAAGHLSHEDAIKIAYFRGVYSADVNARHQGRIGSMVAAGLSESDAEQYLARVPEGSAVVACINSPSSVTLSGDDDSITQLEILLKKDGKFARKLRVKTAYHSPHMNIIADDYLKSMGTIQKLTGTTPPTHMFSSVTGKLVSYQDLGSPYWVQNMVNPVRFSDAVRCLLTHSKSARGRRKTPMNWSSIVEVGPHEGLKGPLNQIVSAVDSKLSGTLLYTSLLFRGKDGDQTAMDAVGQLWSTGHHVDLSKVNGEDERFVSLKSLGDLPSYPWNHSKGFWHEPPMTTAKRFRKEARTDLLGVPLDIQNTLEPRWRNFIRIPENPWIKDHKITGTVLYPGAGLLIMAIEAACQMADPERKLKGIELQDVSFDRALVIPAADQAVETSLSVRPHKTLESWYQFTVFSLPPGGTWTEHSSGSFSIVYEAEYSSNEEAREWEALTTKFESIKRLSTKQVNPRKFYKDLEAIGMGYGPLFTNVVEAAAAPGHHSGYGTVAIPDTKSSMPHEFEYPHLIHPATLDAIFHLLFVGFAEGGALKEATVPVTMGKMYLAANLPQGAGAKYVGYTEAVNIGEREFEGNIVVSDEKWSSPKIIIQNFAAREVSSGASAAATLADSLSTGSPKRCAQPQWKEDVEYFKGTAAQTILRQEAANGGAYTQLSSWLERACHKDADLSVLVVDHKSSTELLDVVRAFGPQPGKKSCFNQCLIASASQENLDVSQQAFVHDGLNLTYKTLTLDYLPEEQGYEPSSYDLIIADTALQSGVPTDVVLSHLKSLLSAGGRLALAGPKSEMIVKETGWCAALTEAKIGDLMIYIENDASELIIASSTATTQTQATYDEIILLERPKHSPDLLRMKDMLRKKLTGQGLRIRSALLSEVADLKGRAVVSLLEAEEPFVIKWTSEELENFKRLVSSTAYLLWITRGGSTNLDFAPSTGLLRTVRTEVPQITLPHLDLTPGIDLAAGKTADIIASVFYLTTRESGKNNEMEFVEKNGNLMIPRVIDDLSFDRELELHSDDVSPVMGVLSEDARALKLQMGTVGIIDTLRWVADDETTEPLAADDVEIATTTVSLNESDLEAVLGHSMITTIGREAAGVVVRVGPSVTKFRPGQTVVTLKSHSFRTRIRQHQSFVQAVPRNMSKEVAASLPVPFTTAYHAIINIGLLQRGESILILDAAKGLGQAAIQIAQFLSAEIFATAASDSQRAILTKNYGIPEDHIFDSKSRSFSTGVSRITKGNGVDVVFGSSSGIALIQATSCIADFGRFVDIGNKINTTELRKAIFRRNISFSTIDIEHMARSKGAIVAELLQKVFDLVRLGLIREFAPTTPYSIAEVDKALGWMQTDDYSGKIMLNFNDDAIVPMLPAKPPLLELDPSATYVISGGLGGLGPSIAETMYQHGARHIVFLSRSGANTAEQRQVLSSFKERGCRADAIKCDVSNAQHVGDFISACAENGWQIKGVIQCAMVLRDSVLENMTFDKWQAATQPKIAGTWNLHSTFPKNLNFFIMLSSVIGIIGNAGQANYSAGNTYQDAVAHFRRSQGLAAVSLNVGLVSDARAHFNEDHTIEDFLAAYIHLVAIKVTDEELNIVITAAMRGTTADGVPVPAQLIAGLAGGLQREGSVRSLWTQDRKFDHRIQESMNSGDIGNENKLKDTVRNATTLADAAKAVEDALKANLAAAMSSVPEDIDGDKPLHALGIDSLKAVEVRNWIFRELKSDISVFDILSPISLTSLSLKMARKSKLINAELVRQAAEEGLDD